MHALRNVEILLVDADHLGSSWRLVPAVCIVLVPAVGFALVPSVGSALVPAVGFALVPSVGSALVPAVGFALSVLLHIMPVSCSSRPRTELLLLLLPPRTVPRMGTLPE